MTNREIYEQTKAEMLKAVDAIREEHPLGQEAAAYLLEHLHFDDDAMSFMYDGDPAKLQIRPASPKEVVAALKPCKKCGDEHPQECKEVPAPGLWFEHDPERCVVCRVCHRSSGFFPTQIEANAHWNRIS
jgi:NAD-dependent dihydropyrimidine dehydrogenase PreA subunit